MVPVLSSSRVETSPAASTARPDIARTLRCTSRSIPATPIAETSAPMVVGIRHTSRQTSTTTDWVEPANAAIGCNAITTNRNTIVSPASRMLRAISFGVFCRTEPSTSAIIRSTNDFPGSVVIFTTIRSESTVVPPVTEDRSPPDSRTTGADSPVIADSLTLATPSTTSPSPGITSPTSHTTRSPTFELSGRHGLPGVVGKQPTGGQRVPARSQGRGLGLAPPFGDRVGQVGEQHGQPQPDRHGDHETGRFR